MGLWLRIALFLLILAIGTSAALVVGETTGLALADLSNAPVQAMTETGQDGLLYAALNGERAGIYRSDERGLSWQRVNTGPGAPVSALAVHPTDERVLYAGTVAGEEASQSNLWYSNDGGQTWDRTRLVLPADSEGQLPLISALAVAPDQPNVLYVGTEGQGLYRYYVGHGRYERIGGNTQQNLYIKEVVTGPANEVYAVTTEGLIRVRGNSGQKIETLPDVAVSLAVDPTDSQLLYAGTVGYGAYRSTDGGQSWTPINEGLGWQPGIILNVPAITVDKENPEHLALATALGVGSQWAGQGIYESFDGGQSWQKVADSQVVVQNLSIKDNGIYVATETGLVRFGEPVQAASGFWQRLQSLASPTGMQILILVLTILFGAWVLVGRLFWWPGEEPKTV
jgi:photosystem II stability/assembly factor-like uncharacterized protein